MDNAIKVQCTHCHATFGAKSQSSLGKTARCPKCSKKFVLQEKEPDEDDFLDDIGENRPTRRRSRASSEPQEVPRALPRPELRRLRKKSRPDRSEEPGEEGGLLTMGFPLWIVGGSIGALIGIGMWSLVGYLIHLPMGWMAVGLGFMVGLGVRMAAGTDDGIAPGLTAAVITVLAILLAKFLVAVLLAAWVAQHFVRVVDDVDTLAIRQIADEIVDERVDAGQKIEWPEKKHRFFGGVGQDVSKEYPPDIWAEATRRWESTPIEEQQARREKAEKEKERAANEKRELESGLVGEALRFCFGILDLLWIPLATFTAFQLGANVASN